MSDDTRKRLGLELRHAAAQLLERFRLPLQDHLLECQLFLAEIEQRF